MTKELQDYYEQQMQMFLHPGWAHFISQVNEMRASLDTLRGATKDNVENRQGQLEMVNWVIEWPETLKKAYDELLTADSLADQDADI